MKSQVQKVNNGSFSKNIIVLMTGTAMAQIIYMALSPIITRMYGPEAYGLLGTFMAMVGVIGPIAALTYPIAIVLPKKDEDAKGLIKLSLIISVLVAGLSAVFLLIFYQQIVQLLNLEKIASFLYLLPLVIILSGFLQVSENWFIRTKQFKVSAKVTVWQALIIQGSMVLIGMLYPVASVLIMVSVLGIGIKAIMMFVSSRDPYPLFVSHRQADVSQLKMLAKRHNDFPVYRAPEVFLNTVSQGLPILLLASFFGPASAGAYAICNTVLSMPSQLIGKSVGDVLYPRLSEAKHNGEKITKLIKKVTYEMSIKGALPFVVVMAFGPWLFGFVFGSEWVIAGEYARWVALWSFFGFINKPSVLALPVLAAQAFQLKYSLFMLVSRTVALALAYYIFSNDIAVVAIFSIIGALLNIGLIWLTLRISRRYDENINME